MIILYGNVFYYYVIGGWTVLEKMFLRKKKKELIKYLMCLNMLRSNLYFWQIMWGGISERIIEQE